MWIHETALRESDSKGSRLRWRRWHVVFVRCCWSQPSNLLIQLSYLCGIRSIFVSTSPATALFLHLTTNLSLPPAPPFFLSSLTSVRSDKDIPRVYLCIQSLQHCSLSTSDSFSLIYSVSLSLRGDFMPLLLSTIIFPVVGPGPLMITSPAKSWLYKTLVAHTHFALASFFQHDLAVTLWKTSLLALQLSAQLIPPELILQFRSYWGWHC